MLALAQLQVNLVHKIAMNNERTSKYRQHLFSIKSSRITL
jgi:hypothetical protein